VVTALQNKVVDRAGSEAAAQWNETVGQVLGMTAGE
jgi:hypothetical protein